MTAPDAIVIREEVTAGPTRRYVYHPLAAGGYERKTQLWRQATDGWHTTGTEVVESLAIDTAEGRR